MVKKIFFFFFFLVDSTGPPSGHGRTRTPKLHTRCNIMAQCTQKRQWLANACLEQCSSWRMQFRLLCRCAHPPGNAAAAVKLVCSNVSKDDNQVSACADGRDDWAPPAKHVEEMRQYNVMQCGVNCSHLGHCMQAHLRNLLGTAQRSHAVPADVQRGVRHSVILHDAFALHFNQCTLRCTCMAQRAGWAWCTALERSLHAQQTPPLAKACHAQGMSDKMGRGTKRS